MKEYLHRQDFGTFSAQYLLHGAVSSAPSSTPVPLAALPVKSPPTLVPPPPVIQRWQKLMTPLQESKLYQGLAEAMALE